MRIAVIGTGIAGLGAAYAFSRAGHHAELFEREPRAGGHTHTVAVEEAGRTLAIDTGFIVHNERNYPNLVRLFAELGVATQPSDMSFSVSCARCGIEWAGRRPFAQPRNALRPSFLRMVRDVVRFLREAPRDLEAGTVHGLTLAAYVAERHYSRPFLDHFLVPLTAAIWSTAPERALDFPAAYALRFFENHGMLGFRRYPWRTVVGGSSTYVEAILDRIGRERLHLGAPVAAIRRDADGVELTLAGGGGAVGPGGPSGALRFDGVVVAVHAAAALPLLADPSDDERRILGAFGTTLNETVLHTDERILPRARAARAAWNYHLDDCRSPAGRPTLTYSMNRLQRLDSSREYQVTLNRGAEIDPGHVIRRIAVEHPLYTFESLVAQDALPALQGLRRTAFAGAWQGYGFHEDGLVSGLRAAEAFGVRW
jgi:predicted NAD/FAD-binding protein